MKQPRRLSFSRIALLLAAAIALVAVFAWLAASKPAAPGSEEPPLAGAPIGGDFALTDQDGGRVTNDSLKGRYRLVYFGYSFCPDVCPVDVQRMAQGLKSFEAENPAAAARVQPVFVTVDPDRDTVAVLKEFVAAFHPRLIGLTGTTAEIDAAKRTYRVYAAKGEGTDSENYLMDHSAFVYLMDPDGKPITYFERDDDAAMIAAGLAKWVR
ncbi:SCO family protein [Sphingosinicella soli]|uniref:Protein SCO1/2 n=1 Tax=Sphingosinicella soli TaxID=333708 RepID=A0A7W7B538_9SPHN|nr:SCO family protein [Sphingosinicella soli]MBB4633092.1 protein SCO1/2 [Sphingosinicella soli]